ncbi:MAG TPA: PAS domain S-box protein, partial [Anaerolineales bacterium]|nr:PAS domain S-box protein [Anaerolineales bacterium]
INFTHPDDRSIQQENIRKDFSKAGQIALETGQTIDDVPDPKEFRIIRPDGSICWVQGDAIEYVDEQGNPLRMLGILRDITKQKLDEQAIRESEEKYRLLFEEMMDGFALHEIICNEDGQPVDYRFLTVNSAFEKLTGLQASDIVGKTVLEVMPATEKHWIERYGRVALTGMPDHFEEFSGALNTHYEVRTFSPALNKFAVIFHDITQRKHTENITLARIKIVEIASTHSLDKLVQTILDEAEALTGSSIGFYHFMEPDQKTLVLQNWSTRTLKEFCHADGKGNHYNVDMAGVWVDCVHEKKAVIHNDYKNLPHRKGLPEGHAEVTRELVVPVMRKDKILAIVGVGNKESDYTQHDVDTVQQLADLAMEIVERKRVEDENLKIQGKYEHLIQTVEGIVWEADAQTFQFTFVSKQAERLLGYPVSRWLEEPNFWAEHIHPDDRETAVNFCVEQTRAMSAHEFEYRMISLDGEAVWLRDVVTIIKEGDQPVKLRGLMIDITERKKADERLHQLSLAVEQNPASVVITDLGGKIKYVNPKFTQVTGYTLEETFGKTPRILKSGETSLEEYKKLWDTITSGNVWHGEFHNRKKNGELFWEDAMIAPMTDESGRITHFVAVKEDVTERKRSEKEIIEKNADLSALFSISAHLRTAANEKEMLPVILQEVTRAVKSDASAVIQLNNNQDEFVFTLGDGLLESNTGLRFPRENSISGMIMQTLEAYSSSDFSNDPNRTQEMINFENLGPAVLVPLQSESDFLGVFLCARSKDSSYGEFTNAEIRLLSSIGEMVGNALRRTRLYDDALSRLQRVQALRAIDAGITSNSDLKITLNILLNQALTLLEMDAADILIINPLTLKLEFEIGQGFRTNAIEHTQLYMGEGIGGRVALERTPVQIIDISREEITLRGPVFKDEGFKSMIIAPMITKGQVRGVLEMYSRKTSTPDEEWMDFLEALAAQAAIAIDNSQLYNDLQQSNLELKMAYDATIEGWSLALDLKDKETETHTLRVTNWTLQLAKLAGLSDADLVHIRRGALLHDIGKMGIPDRILKKTGKLTSKEWDLMRKHTIFAYDMLYPIKFLRPAMDIPYCHHEKWDGTGYPRGLKGTQIPYAARIFAIIDVWDALTSDRPYRAAWSQEKTLAHIKEESGKHFDPDIVSLFMELMESTENGQLENE